MEDNLKGYKDKAKNLLEKQDIKVWDVIQIKTEKTTLEGIVLPRAISAAPNFIEIKLDNNYNIGNIVVKLFLYKTVNLSPFFK